MIALSPRQGDIVRPHRPDMVEDIAFVIDFVGCARVILRCLLFGGREQSPQRDVYS
jgi:hypothetical protein